MTITELKTRLAKLMALVEDPQPGMMSWNEMLHSNMEDLMEAWNTTTYDVVHECEFDTISPQADAGIIAVPGDLIKVNDDMVYVVKGGIRHETINYPAQVDLFLKCGHLRKQ
jgi:hypothetical protein